MRSLCRFLQPKVCIVNVNGELVAQQSSVYAKTNVWWHQKRKFDHTTKTIAGSSHLDSSTVLLGHYNVMFFHLLNSCVIYAQKLLYQLRLGRLSTR